MSSSDKSKPNGHVGLKPNGNPWRKNKLSLAHQLKSSSNSIPKPNPHGLSAKSTAFNPRNSTQLQYRHQYARQNQWRNPNGNANNGRNHFSGNAKGNPSIWINDEKQLEDLSTTLHDTLHSHGVFEHGQGSEQRLNVLNHLEHLLNEWSRRLMTLAKTTADINSTTESSSVTRVRLISFGSYRLGVHAPDADLDLLALCPPHVSREDFFSSLVQKLGEDDRCHSIHPIPGAYTPVIKFYMDGIPIDMLFVRLANGDRLEKDVESLNSDSDASLENRKNEFQIEDDMLFGLDGPSSRSLNGVRVAQFLLQIIPNLKSFRIVLKTVKAWAEVHGLYSNVLGFLGGVNWAILVAWVCKRNPEASPPTLLKLFFQTFSRWHWPQPVILTNIVANPPPGMSPLAVWNPTLNRRDRSQIMPIITPCYPSMNSSYNVGQPQLRRLKEELYHADRVMNAIGRGTSQWSDLLRENGFFNDHIHFLQVSIVANNEEDHRAWFGFCESRLRILIAGLDSEEIGTQAYPFSKFFVTKGDLQQPQAIPSKPENSKGGEIASHFFIALRFAYGIENVDLIDLTAEYTYSVNNWDERTQGMDLRINHVLQRDLPAFVFKSSSQNDNQACNNAQDEEVISSAVHEVDSKNVQGTKIKPEISTVRHDVKSAEDCLTSPMLKAKIGSPAPRIKPDESLMSPMKRAKPESSAVLRDMKLPDECLGSPLKKTKLDRS